MVHDMQGALPGTLGMRVCESTAQLAQVVASAVREAVINAVRERGNATLVVTGGSTPRAYYPVLAALDLPWSRVTLVLSDERCVPPTHADSNEKLVRDLLLQDRAAAARFVPLYDAADADPVAGARTRLEGLQQPFDLVLLGVGADSHVASMFPGADGVDAALDPQGREPCFAVTPPPDVRPALPRLSLTLAALLDSRRVLVAAQGLDKRAAFERAVLGHWPLPSPVHALALHAYQPVDFVWCR